MNEEDLKEMTYEQKEARLDEILGRLDRSETPMDQLAAEAKEAAQLIMSMQTTLRAAKLDVTQVFADMEKQKEALGLKPKAE
jgi:exodeoxyribonuclease VII small subunit